ncbi:LIM zinc-binding domain-containing protein [Pleurotus pulmonarius]
MHPFTGTSVCPKCLKAVYAAEQVMGPGRMLYHKPCLACTMCNKRLDSLTLLEHNHKPYCKLCHVKHFGTKDLRQANLPYMPAESSHPPPLPPSPMKNLHAQPSIGTSPANSSDSPPNTIAQVDKSPLSETVPLEQEQAEEEDEERDVVSPVLPPRSTTSLSSTPVTASGTVDTTTRAPIRTMTTGGFPAPHRFKHRFSSSLDSSANNRFNSATMGRSHTATGVPASDDASQSARPLVQTATALGGSVGVNTTGSPNKRWSMGTNPTCPKCGKTVYFAEQVKAIDSTRLTENDGEPFCRQCYGKIHGPRGGGYALLGKAGG